jgi:predicted dehydrogenase
VTSLALAAFAFPAAPGYSGRTMAEKKVKVGFVGAGWMGSQLLRRLSERPDVEIGALVERNADRARQVLGDLKLSPDLATAEYDKVISDKSIDAVVLASPNRFHGPQSIAALKAGKHVFSEKPSATTFDEFVQQVDLEKANPHLITYVDYILYFDSMEAHLRQMAAEDAFGKITQIQVNYRHPINIAGDKAWKLDQAIMGDAIGMGINHALSVMVLLMASQGRPTAVYATSQPAQVRPFEADAIWNILVKFEGGATGFCFGNIDSANGYDAYHNVSGTKGAFVFESGLNRPQKVRYWSEQQTGGKWIYPLDPERCRAEGVEKLAWPADTTTPDSGDVIHHQTAECTGHFIECIKSGTKSPLSFANSAPITEIGWAAQLSAATGKEVKLPMDREAARAFFGK